MRRMRYCFANCEQRNRQPRFSKNAQTSHQVNRARESTQKLKTSAKSEQAWRDRSEQHKSIENEDEACITGKDQNTIKISKFTRQRTAIRLPSSRRRFGRSMRSRWEMRGRCA